MAQTKTKTQKQEVKVKPTIFISQDTLLNLLYHIKGATFAQIKTVTEPSMRKTDNPFIDNIIKESDSNVMLGFNYENIVNNARVKDSIQEAKNVGVDIETLNALMAVFNTSVEDFTPDFEPKPHQWADHSVNPYDGKISRIIVEKRSDKTCKYVQVWILNTQKPVYKYKDSGEILNSQEIKEMKSFLSKKSSNKEYQGLKKEIIIRDYMIQNIKQINMNKTNYYIV